MLPNIKSLPIAVRIYPDSGTKQHESRSRKRWRVPDAMFVFDTETRVDASQRLTFGSYRFVVRGRCLEEGLFYADDLPAEDIAILRNHVHANQPDTVDEGVKHIRLLSRSEFVDRLYKAAYKGRCLLVGFNLPFDLSRVAYDFTLARGRFAGGFALELWSYIDDAGCEQLHPFRPRIGIKHIDSKRALKGFTARNNPDQVDLIPDESTDGKPQEGYKFRGHFLDLRTLAFALTDRSYSLETACEAFGVEHGKQHPATHGKVTDDYVHYNRRDVLATFELADKLLEEYAKHPITLQPTKAYSPASIGKAYLRSMGVDPVMQRQHEFPNEYLGYAASAFFGGRTSAHVRKIPVPVVYTDFLSMYPTVNSLMGLWRFVTAKKINIIEHCQKRIQDLLTQLTEDDLFIPENWKKLTGFVQIIPNGDILPCRAKFSSGSNDWQVAVNHVYAASGNQQDGLWFSLPDIVVSVVLTRRVPTITDAFLVEPAGLLPGLEKTSLRGAIEIDPSKQDFFKVVIEERKRLPLRFDLSELEKDRLDKALKVLANAASYGIYAEMNRQESENNVEVTCHGIDSEPFTCSVAHPDVPGEYCFPPLASLITGAARLMLALLERQITNLGGTYAMEDTDSMAIVATKNGGMIPCPGGPYSTSDGQEAIKALTWQQVEDIAERFAKLNPYERDAVPDSILKIESDNSDPITGKQRQLYCLAISAKRYNLFLIDRNGNPALLRATCPHCGCKNKPKFSSCTKCKQTIHVNNNDDRWSEHGLGHLLNPSDPESEDREWIAQAWFSISKRSLGIDARPMTFQNLPAVGRITISSPSLMRPLESFNAGKKYCDRIKPFNFLSSCHVKQMGHPIGTDPTRFHLVKPYNSDSREWLKTRWIDQYSGKLYRITTDGYHGNRQSARVKTYGEVLREYEFHPEAKCADKDGNPCCKQTTGLLQRRHIKIDLLKYIGKESNSLEDVQSGLIHSDQNVYTEYPDPRRDEWQTKILPVLQKIPLSKLIEVTGKSRRALTDARTGKRRPHPKNQRLLAAVVKKLGLI